MKPESATVLIVDDQPLNIDLLEQELAAAGYRTLAERGGEGSISASLIKSTIKRVHPGFSESQYGYTAFGKILDDAHKKGSLVVERKEGGAVIVSLPPSRTE